MRSWNSSGRSPLKQRRQPGGSAALAARLAGPPASLPDELVCVSLRGPGVFFRSVPRSFKAAVKLTHKTQQCATRWHLVYLRCCASPHWVVPEHSVTPKGDPEPQSSRPSPWQPLTYVLSLRVGLFWSLPAHGLPRRAAVGLASRTGRPWAVGASGFMLCYGPYQATCLYRRRWFPPPGHRESLCMVFA